MPVIDTALIDGFENLNDGEKVAALLKLDIPEKIDLSAYVKKELYDKTSSELAAAKRSLKEKMTTDDAAQTQAAEERAELENKYNELLKKSTIAEHTAKYLALGYDAELAKSTAEAIYDGDMDKVIENQQKFNAAREKEMKAEIERKLYPNGGGRKNEEDTPELTLAKSLGKRASDAAKSASDGFKNYIKS